MRTIDAHIRRLCRGLAPKHRLHWRRAPPPQRPDRCPPLHSLRSNRFTKQVLDTKRARQNITACRAAPQRSGTRGLGTRPMGFSNCGFPARLGVCALLLCAALDVQRRAGAMSLHSVLLNGAVVSRVVELMSAQEWPRMAGFAGPVLPPSSCNVLRLVRLVRESLGQLPHAHQCLLAHTLSCPPAQPPSSPST